MACVHIVGVSTWSSIFRLTDLDSSEASEGALLETVSLKRPPPTLILNIVGQERELLAGDGH